VKLTPTGHCPSLGAITYCTQINNQPVLPGTRSFLYVNNLAVAVQYGELPKIKTILLTAVINKIYQF